MTQRAGKIVYWVFTLLFVVPIGAGGITYLLGLPMNVEGIVHLGYPVYLLKLLGVAKLLGIVAILTRRYLTLTEWAYAGFTFDLLGASYSHLSSGDGPKALFPLIMLAIMFVSYAQWKMQSRVKEA